MPETYIWEYHFVHSGDVSKEKNDKKDMHFIRDFFRKNNKITF